LNFNLLWLREARKRLALAAASTITGRTNYVARIATVIASSDSTEQSLQTESREVEQMTTRTAIGIAKVAARIAVGNDIARSAVTDHIARIATIVATAFVALEQVPERPELWRDTTVDIAARIAIGDDITRIAVVDNIAWVTRVRSKQATQTAAQCYSGCATNLVAWITGDNIVTRIARNNRIARIAVVVADTTN